MLSLTYRTCGDLPASDLGFLLHKNPGRWHESDMTFGRVVVFYPQVSETACTVVLAIDVDSVGLMRERKGAARWKEYVNDRPYVANSFLCSGMLEMFRTAMSGRSKERQNLADTEIDLEVQLPTVKVRGGAVFLEKLFEPLGYSVKCERMSLDDHFPEWGDSQYFQVTLATTKKLSEVLNHLYMLIPVLDDDKHYWVNKDEIDKLIRKGGEWLKSHPLQEEITRRYLLRQKSLMKAALLQLTEEVDVDEQIAVADRELEKVERPLSLHEGRIDRVMEILEELAPESVLDLGCGEGKLLKKLIRMKSVKRLIGLDVSISSLERVKRTIGWDRLSEPIQEKLQLVHGSLTYRDQNLEGFEVGVLIEVIEHLDESRLGAMKKILFGITRPQRIILTTPNREYNILFEGLEQGRMRHSDHRFEWTRAEFREWCSAVCEEFGYSVSIEELGPVNDTHGAPSQLAVFSR